MPPSNVGLKDFLGQCGRLGAQMHIQILPFMKKITEDGTCYPQVGFDSTPDVHHGC